MLLDKGATIDQLTEDTPNPILAASSCGHLDVVKLLKDAVALRRKRDKRRKKKKRQQAKRKAKRQADQQELEHSPNNMKKCCEGSTSNCRRVRIGKAPRSTLET